MDITMNVVNLFQNEMRGINTFYCREDVEEALDELENATPDAAPSRRNDFKKMCEWIGGPSGEQILKDRALLEKIPTREEQKKNLFHAFHQMYKKVPTAETYMRRIVDNLTPEYKDIPLRLAILKQFILGAGLDCKAFPMHQVEEWVLETVSKSERDLYHRLSAEEKIKYLADHVQESVFDKVSSSGSMNEEEIKSVREKLLQKLQSKDLKDKDGNLFPYQVLVDHINAEEKEFQKLARSVFYQGRTGEPVSVNDMYKTDKRDAKRRIRHVNGADVPEILTVCQNLADGKFLTNNGKTRAYLYYFAMMFHMEVSMEDGIVVSDERNFEKNLFHDYYSDHLLRFLKSNSSDQEKEPVGEGINYKNYVEMVYLYYLYRQDLPYTPGQRIDQAEKIISEVYKAAGKKKDSELELQVSDGTIKYRDSVESKMLALSEKEISSYISRNFVVIPKEAASVRIMVSSEEMMAHDLVCELLEKYEEYQNYAFIGAYSDSLRDKKDEFGKKLREEVKWLSVRDDSFARELMDAYLDDKEFITIIEKLEERVSTAFGWTKKNSSDEAVPRRITRNQMVSAFTMMYVASIIDIGGLETFSDIYSNFKGSIDPYLVEARFQPFSEKNLLDMYLLLSVYYYLICNGKG